MKQMKVLVQEPLQPGILSKRMILRLKEHRERIHNAAGDMA